MGSSYSVWGTLNVSIYGCCLAGPTVPVDVPSRIKGSFNKSNCSRTKVATIIIMKGHVAGMRKSATLIMSAVNVCQRITESQTAKNPKVPR